MAKEKSLVVNVIVPNFPNFTGCNHSFCSVFTEFENADRFGSGKLPGFMEQSNNVKSR